MIAAAVVAAVVDAVDDDHGNVAVVDHGDVAVG